jgi:hypothetical protein
VQKRPIENRHDRFRGVERERTKPGALAPGEQNRLHDNLKSYLIIAGARVVSAHQ